MTVEFCMQSKEISLKTLKGITQFLWDNTSKQVATKPFNSVWKSLYI